MNDINIETELKEILSQGLIKEYKLHKDNTGRIEGFAIEILEGNSITFELGDNSCYVEKKSKSIYESFEAILQSLSPLYSLKFNDILIEKMNQFQSNQN